VFWTTNFDGIHTISNQRFEIRQIGKFGLISVVIDVQETRHIRDRVRAVFIRAPTIERVWNDTRVWAEYKGTIIGTKKENILALTFHPELSDDLRIHEYFLTITRR
jgi:glutamine amidotransferase PdxT